MRFSDIAHTCAQNLLRRKSRTILTVLGVIVGCCSIVLMISIGQGISEQNEQMLKSMGNLNDITVTAAGGSGAYDSSGVGMSSLSSSDMTSSDQQAKLDDAAVQTFRGISGVAAVMPQRSAQSTVDLTAGAGSRYVAQYASVMGTDMTQLEASGYKLVQGRMPKDMMTKLTATATTTNTRHTSLWISIVPMMTPGVSLPVIMSAMRTVARRARGRSRSSTY